MKVMVVGGGGREHAIIKSLKKSKKISELFCAPGNGGIAQDATCVPIDAKDIFAIRDFAKEHHIDFVVVSPDDPLVLGCVDVLNEAGIKTFGPRKNAAIIEGSKSFAKNLMKKYGIPTALYEVFDELDAALSYVKNCALPLVIKADGLALGKGVVIAITMDEAFSAIKMMMKENAFGESGKRVVVEEFLTGPEVSVLAFTDGKTIVPMVSSQDHKRALDGDEGLNTGGMGTVAPNPYYTKEIADECMQKIFLPTIQALQKEGREFSGCLYFGLMLTASGPKVIEYNCRFGDPEAQVVLPLLETDLFEIMQKISEQKLSDIKIEFSKNYACCVVMASKGYPKSFEKGFPITIENRDIENTDGVFVAGARLEDGTLVTSGGRVLGVTNTASTLEGAISGAYKKVSKITFENAYYRNDIGKKALEAKG